jgi:hypothetical protein
MKGLSRLFQHTTNSYIPSPTSTVCIRSAFVHSFNHLTAIQPACPQGSLNRAASMAAATSR